MNNADILNNRLANAIGIKKIYYEEWDTEHQSPMFIPSGKPWRTHQIDAMPVPKFYLSMDSCMKWIWNKIEEKTLYFMDIEITAHSGIHVAIADINTKKVIASAYTDDDLPLAFCLAADKYFTEVK